MSKKFEKTVNTALPETGVKTGKATERVFRGERSGRQQITATIEEQEQRKAEIRTQGRKGCKLTRINFALTPNNLQYIKALAQVSGLNMTRLLNRLIEEHMQNHPTLSDKSKEILQEIMGTDKPTKKKW